MHIIYKIEKNYSDVLVNLLFQGNPTTTLKNTHNKFNLALTLHMYMVWEK